MRTAIALVAVVVACNDDEVSRTLGARCERTGDCADRCLGPSGDYPDGLCSIDCRSSSECPGDAECVDREGGVCLFACREPIDCEFLGPQWTCKEDNDRGDPNRKVLVCRGD